MLFAAGVFATNIGVVCLELELIEDWVHLSRVASTDRASLAEIGNEWNSLLVSLQLGASPHHTASAFPWGKELGRANLFGDPLITVIKRNVSRCCAACGATGNLLTCKACGLVKYCNGECQSLDFRPRHKAECKHLRALVQCSTNFC